MLLLCDSRLVDLEERQKEKRSGRRSITDLLVAPQDPHQRRRGSHSPRIQRAHSTQDPGTEIKRLMLSLVNVISRLM